MIEFRPGMKVYIDKQAKFTQRTNGVVPEMKPLLGTVQVIESVMGDTVTIRSWGWNTKDLTPAMRQGPPLIKTISPTLFDESEIIGE